jgi:hypothetical protein
MSVVPRMTIALIAVSQLVYLTAAAAQPVPVGPEFQLNAYTTGNQLSPAVAADGAGNFVAVWRSSASSGSDTGSYSVQGQRFDSSGAPQGGQFQVNTYTTGLQDSAAVAADAAGNFVVVWRSYGSVGTDTFLASIQGQRYDSSGAALGGQFQVNTNTTNNEFRPAVAADGAGNFFVTWGSGPSGGTDTDSASIQGRRYNSSGAAQGAQFQVNTYTTSVQNGPAVAADGAGNFVVVWESNGSLATDPDWSVQGQRYDSSGMAQGGEFQVNTYTTSSQGAPKVAADAAGNFVVVWESYGSPGTDPDFCVQGQRYDSSGAPQGGQFQVNTYTTSFTAEAAVAADGAGSFVVVWWGIGSAGTDTSYFTVQGRRYDSNGAAQGAQFQVNTYTPGYQRSSGVAMTGAGSFVVVWESDQSYGPDNLFSIQGQRFTDPTTSSTTPSTSTSSSSTTTSTSSSTTLTTLPTTDLLPGRIAIIKPVTLAKFVAKPIAGDTFALPTANPIATGGSLRIFDTDASAGDDTYSLPAGAAWKGLGNPAGSKGYKYSGAGTPTDPCKVVLVKETVIKGVCKGTGVTLTPSFTGDVGIVLSLGATDRYCAQFGGDTVKSDPTIEKRKDAPAPGACP